MKPRTQTDGVRLPLVTAGAVGLVVTIVGTFLPWLKSGSAERNSYAAGGAVRRLLRVSHPIYDLLGAWPLLGLAAALALAALLLGRHVAGFTLALLVSVFAGGCAIAVLPIHGSRYAQVVRTGPITTLVGAMLIALTTMIIVGTALARRLQ